MDRIKYINEIRMKMFNFHLLITGVLSGLVVQKLDLTSAASISHFARIVIGSVGLGVSLVGVSLFVFDLWALARHRATTAGIHNIVSPETEQWMSQQRPWFGFDEDFWVSVPMMFINSAVLAISVLLLGGEWRQPLALMTAIAVPSFLIHVLANRFVPKSIARRLQEWPDSVTGTLARAGERATESRRPTKAESEEETCD
jgi:hypothetical protein